MGPELHRFQQFLVGFLLFGTNRNQKSLVFGTTKRNKRLFGTWKKVTFFFQQSRNLRLWQRGPFSRFHVNFQGCGSFQQKKAACWWKDLKWSCFVQGYNQCWLFNAHRKNACSFALFKPSTQVGLRSFHEVMLTSSQIFHVEIFDVQPDFKNATNVTNYTKFTANSQQITK